VILKTSVLRVNNHHRTSQKKIQLISKEGRLFFAYEEQLKELYRFCPKCGSFTVDAHEIQNEGSQLSIDLTCQNSCSYKWQSQPPWLPLKAEEIFALTAAIFSSGIHFAKFERFAHCLKLKTISESSYYVLRFVKDSFSLSYRELGKQSRHPFLMNWSPDQAVF